jgi:hypothetical protein
MRAIGLVSAVLRLAPVASVGAAAPVPGTVERVSPEVASVERVAPVAEGECVLALPEASELLVPDEPDELFGPPPPKVDCASS